jgi:hypothetical protein
MSNSPDRHADDELFVDILNGLASESDAAAVYRHLRECPECEATFVRLAREHERLRADDRPVLTPGGVVLEPLGEKEGSAAGWRAVATRGRAVAVAAVVVAAVVTLVFAPRLTRSPSGDGPVYWMPAEPQLATLRTRDSNDSSDDVRTLSVAIEAYERHDAAETIRLLESISIALPYEEYDVIALLYLASARVNTGDFEGATTAIDGVLLGYMPYRWRQQGRWVLYLAHEGLGRSEEALQYLEPLLEDTGELGERARAEKARRGSG